MNTKELLIFIVGAWLGYMIHWALFLTEWACLLGKFGK